MSGSDGQYGDDVEAAIAGTLPTAPGQRNRAVFALARRLKAIPELACLPATAHRAIVAEWHRRALLVIRTREWETTWSDWLVAWDRVALPAGVGMSRIAETVRTAAPHPVCAAMRYSSAELVHLVGICAELDRIHSGRSWFLSCRVAGKLLGEISHERAWLLLRLLVADGILEITRCGDRQRATRYRMRQITGDGNAPPPP
jgi:hypothetical protein